MPEVNRTNDLVAELRRMARELSKIVGEPVEECAASRAASEIERLRARVAALEEFLQADVDAHEERATR